MTSRLTITLDKEVIERAKRLAKKRNMSLSKFIEQYLKLVTTKDDKTEDDLTPKVKKLMGSVKLPSDIDPEDARYSALKEKYKL